jgi:hypothetical protein
VANTSLAVTWVAAGLQLLVLTAADCCCCCCCRYGPCEAEALKGRMLRAVASLGAAEVKSILEEQGQVEVRD